MFRVRLQFHLLRIFWVAGLCALAPQAWAQALAIVPINQQLSAQERSASFTLTNHSDREALVQVRGYSWSQTERDDLYSPTTELIVSPPFARIAPGSTQVVRFLLQRPAGASEQAYRIVFDQIPDRISGRVEMALRLTVPVFSSALQAGQPDVQWRVVLREGKAILKAFNQGSQHAQLVNLTLTGDDGQTIKLKGQGLPYILSGALREWSLVAAQGSLTKSRRLHLQTSGPGRRWDQWLVIEAND